MLRGCFDFPQPNFPTITLQSASCNCCFVQYPLLTLKEAAAVGIDIIATSLPFLNSPKEKSMPVGDVQFGCWGMAQQRESREKILDMSHIVGVKIF